DAEQMIMAQEGTGPMRNGRFFAYDDATGRELKTGDRILGNITIGYGHNLFAKGLCSKLVIDQLRTDIAEATDDAKACCPSYEFLTRTRQLVLLNMAYNLGRERLTGFTRMLTDVQREEWESAADEILDSDAARALPTRYLTLSEMMRKDENPWV